MSIKLGDRAKDKLTGFSGIVTGTSDHLTGCRRIGIQPEKLKDDGTIGETNWFDADHVIVIKAGVYTPVNQLNGGPSTSRNTPTRSSDPR
jgi:hypothetical protein